MPTSVKGTGANAAGTADMRAGSVSAHGHWGIARVNAVPAHAPANMSARICPPTNPEPCDTASVSIFAAAVHTRNHPPYESIVLSSSVAAVALPAERCDVEGNLTQPP